MGVQGPLTAQALGRSPYDEVVDGEGEADTHMPPQQYDSRGRPINPETKRINRDIIRSHNEVMLVIGVAEPENQQPSAEVESQRRHEAYEDRIGSKLVDAASRTIDIVGLLGLHSLRQRVLLYKDYSELPFWRCFQRARSNFSISRDILAGVPTGLVMSQIEMWVSRTWDNPQVSARSRQIAIEIMSYFKVHFEIFLALQRVGLVPATQLFPKPSYFIPFTSESPIPSPGLPDSLSLSSIGTWLARAVVSTAPFLMWMMARRLYIGLRLTLWGKIHRQLPSTAFRTKRILSPAVSLPPPPPPPPPPPLPAAVTPPTPDVVPGSSLSEWIDVVNDEPAAPVTDAGTQIDRSSLPTVRRQSIVSARGDEYVSDEEEPETVTATLISLDIEATDHDHDAPPGLWSAELRPSLTSDSRPRFAPPIFLDTTLTRFPAILATGILTDTVARILMSPFEAVALRFIAQDFVVRRALSGLAMHSLSPFRNLSLFAIVNFLGAEFLHFSVLSDVWAVFTALTEHYHLTEEEWKEAEELDEK